MPENTDTKKTAPETETQKARPTQVKKSSRSSAPFAAPNLPKPVRQSYVAQGCGTEELVHALRLAIEFLKKFLKESMQSLDTDVNREIGGAAARTAAKGFGDSFAGVACAISDLKEVIDKKSPRYGAMLDQAGETAKTLGQKMKTAGAEVAPKLKDLKEPENLELAKEKIIKYAVTTDRVISVGAEGAGKRLKKVAHGTGIIIGGLKDIAVTKIEERRAEKDEDNPDDTEGEIKSVSKPSLKIAKAALDKAGEKIQSLNQVAGTGIPNDHGQGEFSKKIDEQLNKLGVIVPQKTAQLTKISIAKAGGKLQSLNQSAGTGVPNDHGQGEFSKKIDEQLNKLGVIVPQKTVQLTKISITKAGEKIQSLNQRAGTGVPNDHGQGEFSKKIDERLNTFGIFISKKSAALTNSLIGKTGEKIRSMRRDGTRSSENSKTEELQTKLTENIKNLGDAVTKKNAEETIKKFAVGFSDKAKTLADSARQKVESISKSDADSQTKVVAPSEKISDLKDKVAEGAREIAEGAKEKIDAVRSPREAEPAKDVPTSTPVPEPVNSDPVKPEPEPTPAVRKTRTKSSATAAKTRASKTGASAKSSASATKSGSRSTPNSQTATPSPKVASKRTKNQNKTD